MFLSNLRQTFLLLATIAPIIQACGSSPTNSNRDFRSIETHINAFPFSVEELPVYSGELVQTSGGETMVFFVARNGDKTRLDFDAASENRVSHIQSDSRFVISHKTKTYYELSAASGGLSSTLPVEPLIRGFLGAIEPSKFEKIGVENGRTKYRVDYMPGKRSENYIYFDEAVRMPVRQELFTLDGDQRTMVFSVEFRDLKLAADESLFAVPTGFRKTDAPK